MTSTTRCTPFSNDLLTGKRLGEIPVTGVGSWSKTYLARDAMRLSTCSATAAAIAGSSLPHARHDCWRCAVHCVHGQTKRAPDPRVKGND